MYNFPVNEFTSADEKLTVIVFCSLKAISVIVGVTEKGDDSPFSTERVAFNVFIPSLESIWKRQLYRQYQNRIDIGATQINQRNEKYRSGYGESRRIGITRIYIVISVPAYLLA